MNRSTSARLGYELDDETGITAVGDARLVIDRLFFVELVAEPVGRPLQLQRQAGLAVANRPVGETRQLYHDRLARAHGGAVARRRRRRARPAMEGVDARGERVGAPDDAPTRDFGEWLRRRARHARCHRAERHKSQQQQSRRGQPDMNHQSRPPLHDAPVPTPHEFTPSSGIGPRRVST
jgi:hypothetical protein